MTAAEREQRRKYIRDLKRKKIQGMLLSLRDTVRDYMSFNSEDRATMLGIETDATRALDGLHTPQPKSERATPSTLSQRLEGSAPS